MNLKTKKITKYFLSLFVLFICFDAVASKQLVTLTPKRMIYEFEKIEGKVGFMLGELSFRGFSFSQISIKKDEKCKQYESYFFKMAALFSYETNNQDIDAILQRCPNANTVAFRALLNISSSNLESEKKLRDYLAKYLNDEQEINKILQMYQVKQKIHYRKELVAIFNKLVASFDDKNTKYEEHASTLGQLSRFPDSILKKLSELLVAIKIKNKGWAFRLYDQILDDSHDNLLFNLESNFFVSDAQKRRFEERLSKMKDILLSFFVDDVKKEMLMKVIGSLVPTDSKLKKEMAINWSLKDIRKYASMRSYGARYPWFWFSMLYARASEVEAIAFLKNILTSKYVEQMGTQVAPMLVYYYPSDNKARRAAIRNIRLLMNSKDRYEQYLLLELLKNNVVKRDFTKKNLKYRRSRAVLERTFYRETIQMGLAVNFSLYNLYRLGDLDDSLLWWVVL